MAQSSNEKIDKVTGLLYGITFGMGLGLGVNGFLAAGGTYVPFKYVILTSIICMIIGAGIGYALGDE